MPKGQTNEHNITACYGPAMPDDLLGLQIAWTVSDGPSRKAHEAKRWKGKNATLQTLIDTTLANHRESKHKFDGVAGILPGVLSGTAKSKKAVTNLTMLVADSDGHANPDDVRAAIGAWGVCAVVVTSYSHLKKRTFIESVKLGEQDPIAYLREKKAFSAEMLEGAEIGDVVHVDEGIGHYVTHAPLPKFRVWVPLSEPFNVLAQGGHPAALDAWEEINEGFVAKIGVVVPDRTAYSAEHMQLQPTHPPGGEYEVHVFRGPLARWQDIPRIELPKATPHGGVKGRTKTGTAFSVSPSGIVMPEWYKRGGGAAFMLTEAYRQYASEAIRNDGGSKVEAECPFDEEHSDSGNPEDRAFFVMDAPDSENGKCVAFCGHDHCKLRWTTDFLVKAIENETLPESVLADRTLRCEIVGEGEEFEPNVSDETIDEALLNRILPAVNSLTMDTRDTEVDAILEEAGALGIGLAQRAEIARRVYARTGRPIEMSESTMRMAGGREALGTCIFDDAESVIAAINKQAAVIIVDGSTKIMLDDDRDCGLDFLDKTSAALWFAPLKYHAPKAGNALVKGGKKGKASVSGEGSEVELKSGFAAWEHSAKRRVFRRVGFWPHKKAGGACGGGSYNRFTGWRVKPEEGSWRRLARHSFHVVCSDDPELFEWNIAWYAQMFQQPGKKPGVARGIHSKGKGTGKTIVTLPVRRIWGPHALVVSRSDDLLGRFNSHLEEAVYVVSEESTWAGNRKQYGEIKHLITGDTLRYEGKYRQSREMPNYSRFDFIGNDERAFAVEGGDERRIAVTTVAEQYKGRTKEYFDPLYAEIAGKGTAAFLHDTLKFDIERVDLRKIPQTGGLIDQLEANLPPEEKWLLGVLQSGAFTGRDGSELEAPAGWEEHSVTVERTAMFESYRAIVKPHGRGEASDADIRKFLYEAFPGLRSTQVRRGGASPRAFVLPALPPLRNAFRTRTGVIAEGDDGAEGVVEPVTPRTLVPVDDLFDEAARQIEIARMDAIIDAVLYNPRWREDDEIAHLLALQSGV